MEYTYNLIKNLKFSKFIYLCIILVKLFNICKKDKKKREK